MCSLMKPRFTIIALLVAISFSIRTVALTSKIDQFIDFFPYLLCEALHFCRRKPGSPECVFNLVIGKLGQIAADPFGMLTRNMFKAPEIDKLRSHVLDERAELKILEDAFTVKNRFSRQPKARSQVGGDITLFRAVHVIDVLIWRFKIDIADQLHHDLEAIEFLGADEWIIIPAPICDLAFALVVTLQAQVFELRAMAKCSSATETQVARDVQFRKVIVFIGEIAYGPDQTRCRCFRLGFIADFDRPASAVFIVNVKFGIHPVEFLFDE